MESPTTITLPRGFVDTTATDGGRLRIYYVRQTPVVPIEDINARATAAHATRPTTGSDATSVSNDAANAAEIIRAKLLRAAEIEVLRDFAAAYTRGESDLNGKEPHEDMRPVGIIIGESTHVTIYTLGTEAYNSGFGQ
ncbi:uncharacterized protein CPUR_00312 [Claviceps purpurea 20.1]|uniref:Uncharacterized protein n=1 Tax=Claviceps purpurea (strain 20.1) TaxID=1111077 RepID=M1W4R0_CLAP2|nr:hypothetical protein E4U45_000643 [Claviceps purpurea]CCE26843.1 uncharacterized protein CPUR_00312 [Claviceps purpurea 20.1]